MTILQGSNNLYKVLVYLLKGVLVLAADTRRHRWDSATEQELSPGSCKSPNPPVLVSDAASEPSSAPRAPFTLCEPPRGAERLQGRLCPAGPLAQEGSPSPPSFPGEFLPTAGSSGAARGHALSSLTRSCPSGNLLAAFAVPEPAGLLPPPPPPYRPRREPGPPHREHPRTENPAGRGLGRSPGL